MLKSFKTTVVYVGFALIVGILFGIGISNKRNIDKPSVFKHKHYLDIPEGTKTIKINIGSSYDPPPPPPDGIIIAFEPTVTTAAEAQVIPGTTCCAQKTKYKEKTYVIPAAVSNYTGMTTFYRDKSRWGDSSSLSKVSKQGNEYFPILKDVFSVSYVPVISFSEVMDSIGQHVDIIELKTDMQGFDFHAVSSGGNRIRRAKKVIAEVYKEGFREYEAHANCFETEWKPFMDKMGFRLVSVYFYPNVPEGDAIWERIDA